MKAREFRESARDSLKGNWIVAIIAFIIAVALGATSGVTYTYNFDSSDVESMPEGLPQVNEPALEASIPFLIGLFVGLFVYAALMIIIGSVVSIGYAEFNLDMVDGLKPRIGTLFAHFGRIKTAVGASLLIFLRVFVGMIFFIIPGIIASLKYSLVFYIIAENPDITAREALERSKEIMWGNKWRCFCLGLSFIGWDLLSALTLGLASLWVGPYRQAAYASFYREVSSNDFAISRFIETH